MHHIILLAVVIPLCFCGCAEQARQTKLTPGTTFEIYTVAAQQGPNTKPLKDPNSGLTLNLVTPPVITAGNVNAAIVTTDDNDIVMLDVNVDHLGAAKLQAATAIAGNQVAIVVNGKIASAPVVQSPIGSHFRVTGAYSRSDWENIVQ